MTVGRIPVIEGGIQPTIFDAKADLLTATANDTPARLAVGVNDYFLQAASGETTGLKWGGAWTTYSPVLKQGTTTVATTGGGYKRFMQVGKTVIVQCLLVADSAGTAGQNIQISLPTSAGAPGAATGSGWVYDASSFNDYPWIGYIDTSSTFLLKPTNAIGAGLWLGSSQFTAALAATDQIHFTLVYEVA
jgi:hypothetical protein